MTALPPAQARPRLLRGRNPNRRREWSQQVTDSSTTRFIAGLDPAIHLPHKMHSREKRWMRGSSPRMTKSWKETPMSANDALHIAVLAGDGIGPEVMAPALDVLRRIEGTSPLKF